MSSDFNSASDMNDIYRNMEKLHKKLKDLGVDLDDIDDQLKLYHATEAKRIHQMRQAIIDWERITHYQQERLKVNKEEKDHRTKRNMEENAEYFRQIRRNMRMRQSHSTLSEQMNLTTKALFGGGLGLGTVFSQLIKGGKAVADTEEEEADKREDIAQAAGRWQEAQARGGVDSEDALKYQKQVAAAQAELVELLKSPSSRLGKIAIHGKTISDRLSGASKFFGTHKLGILLSIGSIGLLVTAMKLVYNTSPMMQASVKLLGLMWNLGLRPIGDFFGFVMRPIFILFLRSFILPWYKVAYPFYQKWGNKIGELMSNFTLQGFADLTWEWFNEADIEMKTFSASLALAIGATGLGGFIIILRGIKALYDKLFPSKTPTPTGANVKPPNPNLNRPALPFYHSQTGGTGTLNIGNQKMLPAPKPDQIKKGGGGNIGMSENIKQWINKQWGRIKMAGNRLGKSFAQMGDQFWKVISKNKMLSRFFTPEKLTGIAKGGTKGVIGFIPPIMANIMEAINPVQWAKDVQALYDRVPFMDPNFFGETAMAQGGIIREPIHGVGRSGRTYSFGEQGAEMVTPMGKGVGGGGITINIQNMSGSQQDLNNLRQTILAVIQEANTRGGRI